MNINEDVLNIYKESEKELHNFFSDYFGELCEFCALVTKEIKQSNVSVSSKYWCCCMGAKAWDGWEKELASQEYGENFEEVFKQRQGLDSLGCVCQSGGCPLDIGRPYLCNMFLCNHQISFAKHSHSDNLIILNSIMKCYHDLWLATMNSDIDFVTQHSAQMKCFIEKYHYESITMDWLLQEDPTEFIKDILDNQWRLR